jgi:plasmid stabilization system protein ParE
VSAYRLTSRADADLVEIDQHLVEWFGVDQAAHVVEAFSAAFEKLAEHAGMGRIRDDLFGVFGRPIRTWPGLRRFIVIRRELDSGPDDIEVVRVADGAKRPPAFGTLAELFTDIPDEHEDDAR